MALDKVKPGDTVTAAIGDTEWTTEEMPGKGLCVVRRYPDIVVDPMPLSEIPQRIAQLENDIKTRQEHIDLLQRYAAKAVAIAAIKEGEKMITEKAEKPK